MLRFVIQMMKINACIMQHTFHLCTIELVLRMNLLWEILAIRDVSVKTLL